MTTISTCIVTGANAGIGRATALGLARAGARVVLVCRDSRRGEAARRYVRDASGRPDVDVRLEVADLSIHDEIERLAERIATNVGPFQVLVNNAAVMPRRRTVTADGLETQFAVNHLAYHHLTRRLLPCLVEGGAARVVNVASNAHRRATIDFDDVQSERGYAPIAVYSRTKLMNLLFTRALARRLAGVPVAVNALHPGVIATGLLGQFFGLPKWVRFFLRLPFGSPEAGARTSIHLATSPAVEGTSGRYFRDCREVEPAPAARDDAAAERLWEVSEALCRRLPPLALLLLVMAAFVASACAPLATTARPGDRLPRRGEEIVVCGQLFHAGTKVVLWNDPGGFDASSSRPRFARELGDDVDPKRLEPAPRFSTRSAGVEEALLRRVEERGWELAELRDVVDQFVLHYDVCGTSRQCFKVLQDLRHLSVHFLLDVDGTIYQTLDLKEKAWHATKANSRSVGIEIAQIGAYGEPDHEALREWYAEDAGGAYLTIPTSLAVSSGFDGVRFRPSRPAPIAGEIQGRTLWQHDFTDAQYEALTRLVATLSRVLPRIELRAPRDASGRVVDRVLDDAEFEAYSGLIGHYHVQDEKVDPGPAFDWDRVIDGARAIVAGGTP